MPAPHHSSSRGDRSLIAIVVVPLILALTLLTFAWPAARLAPRHLPIGVAGPETAAAPLERQLAESDGAFDVHRYAGASEAREAIPGPRGLRRGRGRPAGRHRPDRLGRQPLRRGDARARLRGARGPFGSRGGRRRAGRPAGSARDRLRLAGAAAVLASIVTGVVISLLGRAGPRQIVALLGAAAAAGLVTISMVQGWLGILEGDWWVNAGVLSLTMVAVASVLAGLNGLIGHAGARPRRPAMILVVGNPWSGISSAPELLPTGVGATGQLPRPERAATSSAARRSSTAPAPPGNWPCSPLDRLRPRGDGRRGGAAGRPDWVRRPPGGGPRIPAPESQSGSGAAPCELAGTPRSWG